MGSELWSGQAQNWVNSDFEVKFDLEGQGQLPPKTIRTLTKVFCIFGPNLAILAWTGPQLSRGQASDWHTDRQTDRQTHTHTDAGNDNTRRPKLASGKNLNIHKIMSDFVILYGAYCEHFGENWPNLQYTVLWLILMWRGVWVHIAPFTLSMG